MPELTLDVWRAAAVALAEYACGGAQGRNKDDDVYCRVGGPNREPSAAELA